MCKLSVDSTHIHIRYDIGIGNFVYCLVDGIGNDISVRHGLLEQGVLGTNVYFSRLVPQTKG